jgi:hypothetical protein
VQLENETNEAARGQLRRQLQDIADAAAARGKERAKSRDERRNRYTADKNCIVPEESQRMAELIDQMNDMPEDAEGELKHEELKAEWNALREAEAQRFHRIHRAAIMAGVEIPPPTRESYDDDGDWDDRMEIYRLDLAEASCYRVLNRPKSDMTRRRAAEKQLVRIEQRRREFVSRGLRIAPRGFGCS